MGETCPFKFSVSDVPIRDEVELRISFNLKTPLALIRYGTQHKLVGQQEVEAEELRKVHFQKFPGISQFQHVNTNEMTF